MLEKTKMFFQRLFRKDANLPPAIEVKRYAARRLAAGELPERDSTGCVFEGSWLREITGEKAPSRPLTEKETFWSVYAEDISVDIVIPRADNLPLWESKLSVRFEPEMGLGAFLAERDSLTMDELSDLTRSRFAGLLDTLGGRSDDLSLLDTDSLERLRAKFSLLLSTGGLRCVGLDRFTEQTLLVAEEQQEEAALGEAAESQMSEEIQNVRTQADWSDLTYRLQNEGFPNDADTQSAMNDLGTAWLEKYVTSAQAARSIRQIAENAAEAIGIRRPNNDSYWNGLALRLRLDTSCADDEMADTHAAPSDGERVVASKSRRPKHGRFFRRISLDARLRTFLAQKIHSVQNTLEVKRTSVRDISTVVKMRELSRKLEMANDLTTTLPELNVKTADLRLDRSHFAGFVQELNQAVTAAEYLEAAIISQTFGDTPESVEETQKSAETLILSLKSRHHTRS